LKEEIYDDRGKPVASEPRKITPCPGPFVIITTVAAGAILVCFGVVFVASFYKILGVTHNAVLSNYLDFTSNHAIYNSIRLVSWRPPSARSSASS